MIDPSDLYAAYSKVDPRDRRDSTWFMSEVTLREIVEHERAKQATRDTGYGLVRQLTEIPPFNPIGNMLFGRPIEVDDSMPYGEFRLGVENDQDRAIRRMEAAGRPVIIHKMASIDWSSMRAPKPTLKALLRHWWRQLR